MPRTKTNKFHGPPASTYAKLVAILPPRPLHDAVDYDNAVEMLGNLIGYDLNADQEDYLVAVDTFVKLYEADHSDTQVDTGHITGLDALKHLMNEHGMSGADLSRLLGASRTLGPMIMRGERALTADHIRVLAKRFKVSADLFI